MDRHPYLDLALPAWNNLYQVRDFVRNLRALSATTADGSSLPVHPTGTHTWRIATSGIRSLRLRYKVFANYPGDFYSQIDTEHAFLNGANLFLYLPGHRGVPPTLQIRGVPSAWKIGTALPAEGAARFQAEDYDHLIDCPIEISAFDEAEFSERGVAFRVITHGRQGLDDPQNLVPTRARRRAFDRARVPDLYFQNFSGLGGGGNGARNLDQACLPESREEPLSRESPV
jgi:predicted metalloprotease with PDZ domain